MLLMLIPLTFVESVISDRQQYKNEAISKITDSWGSSAVIAAPILNIPYSYNEVVKTYTSDNKELLTTVTKTRYAKYAPAELITDIDVSLQTRYIGIFKLPVFKADITMSGYFEKNKDIQGHLNEAFISVELNSLKGISEPVLTWDSKEQRLEPPSVGIPLSITTKNSDYYYSNTVALKMLNSNVDFKNNNEKFELKFSLKGSDSINFIPIAKNNLFRMHSDWTDPNFFGAFLPEERNITDKGFEALWDINYLASSVPQRLDNKDLSDAKFGVSFLIPVDNYRNAERAAKYGILFIALTFIVCFVFEIATRRPIHPVQYLLVGFAMVIFYTLLISISEFIDFSLAYVISAAAVVSLITLYAKFGIIKDLSAKSTALVVLSLLFLYGYLYMLLQLQDMALFYGSIGLFVMLGVIMYMTRNIEWYIEEN
jgi:inner membrane protein